MGVALPEAAEGALVRDRQQAPVASGFADDLGLPLVVQPQAARQQTLDVDGHLPPPTTSGSPSDNSSSENWVPLWRVWPSQAPTSESS